MSEARLTIYTTKTCQFCNVVKKYLTLKGEIFNIVDVTDDIDKRKYLHKLTGMTTVPITINEKNEFVVGYNPSKLNNL